MDNLESQKSPFRRLQAATSEYVCRSPFCAAHFYNPRFSLELVPLLAVSVSHELQHHTSALQGNKALCAGVDSLPVNSRSYSRTDNYNFSIMMNKQRIIQSNGAMDMYTCHVCLKSIVSGYSLNQRLKLSRCYQQLLHEVR